MAARILLVVNALGWAGAETQMRYLAVGLSELGYGVTVLVLGRGDADPTPLLEAGVEVEMLDAHGPAAKLRVMPAVVRSARRADVVHCTGWDASLWGRLAAIAARRPVVVTEHTPGRALQIDVKGASRQRAIALHNRLLDRSTYATVVVAAWQIELLEKEGVRSSAIVHIPNAVPLDELRERAELGPDRAALGLSEDSLVIAHAARFSPQKGQPVTLRVAARLREQLGDVRVIFAGAGSEQDDVERMAAEAGATWASFLGWRDDVPRLMRLADLTVLPSAGEGLPMSLIEAMALGTPVVATDVGDVGWLVETVGGGVCVPAGDEDAFTEACARILGDEPLRRRLGAAGVEGSHRFDAEVMTAGYAEVFDAAISAAPIPQLTPVAD